MSAATNTGRLGGERELSDICFELGLALNPETPGTYFEAGAQDGLSQSNTIRLEQELAWSGILVEPSRAFDALTSNRSATNEFVNAALVEDPARESIVGLFNGHLTDTADPTLTNEFTKKTSVVTPLERMRRLYVRLKRVSSGRSLKDQRKNLVSVRATTLDRVFQESKFSTVELFSLDVEGMELLALRGFSWQIRPRVLVIETRGKDALGIAEILLQNDYVLVSGQPKSRPNPESPSGDFLNLIWVDSRDKAAMRATQSVLLED